MRPPDPSPRPADQAYLDELGGIAASHGIARWGVASAQVLSRARAELHRRKSLGLHDSMQFTYKDPDRSTQPERAVSGANAVFVGALAYRATRPPTPVDPHGRSVPAGDVAQYAWADHYGTLRAGLWAVARRLRADGWKAVAYADDNSLVDREVAYLAGIGWYGKNANLLVRGSGSWFVLGSVVTTAPLPANTTLVPDGCGTCSRCMVACPTGAIVAAGVVDAARCLSWVLQRPGSIPVELREAVGHRLYGCDDCQEACPPTVVLGRRVHAPAGPLRAQLDLLDLLDADDDTVLREWGRWYLAGRDPRWVRRNALVALGNVLRDAHHGAGGAAFDPAVVSRAAQALARYGDGADPVLAEHAQWAMRRAGLAERHTST